MRFGSFTVTHETVHNIYAEVFGVSPYDSRPSIIYMSRRSFIYTGEGEDRIGVATYAMANNRDRDILRDIPVGDNAEAYVKAALEAVKAKYCKEPPAGYVKSFLQYGCEKLWRVRRATSSKTFEYSGKYYEASCINNRDFIKVFTALDRSAFRLMISGHAGSGNEVQVGSEWFERDVLIPVYLCRDTGEIVAMTRDYIARYTTPEQAELVYRTATAPDGSTVYINLEKPEAGYFKNTVHNYSARIENFVPEDHLFQYGKVDLYKHRDKDLTPFLGWELEACGPTTAADKIKELMKFDLFCKSDSSIQPSGFETVSVPATLDYWKQSNLSSALDTIRSDPFKMRSFKHESCGFHVHVSRSALSVLDLNKIERFVHNPENNQFLVEVAGRGPNTYAKYVPDLFNNRQKMRPSGGRAAMPREDRPIPSATIAEYMAIYSAEQAAVELIWSFISLSGEMYDAIYQSMINSTSYSTGIEYVIAHYEADNLLSANSKTRIRQILQACFPIRFSETSSGKFENFQCLAKSSAPYDRRKSREASRIVKGPVGKGSVGRYDVLNTGNDKTVEFRLFKGTMNPDSILRYLEFVDAMVRYAWSVGAKDEFLSHSYFCGWLISDPFNIARYEKLVAFLVEKGYIDRKKIRRRKLEYVLDTADNG